MSDITALENEKKTAPRGRKKRGDSARAATANGAATPKAPLWRSSTFGCGLLGAGLLWAAQPPLGLWLLAWIAPLPWLVLVRRETLSGKRPYVALWLAGMAHWLVLLFGLQFAHPALIAGWLALAAYLAVYMPVFVAITRVAVRRLNMPLLLAAPIVWTGLELARGHLFTGCSIGLLAHTQVSQTMLIQIADTFGAYGVSFVVMFAAAGVAQALPAGGASWGTWRNWKFVPLLWAALVVGAALGYGRARLASPEDVDRSGKKLRVALIQESIDTKFEFNPERDVRTYRRYLEQTVKTLKRHGPIDLVVWPESMLAMPDPQMRMTAPEFLVDGEIAPPEDAGIDPREFEQTVRQVSAVYRQQLRDTVIHINQVNGGLRNRAFVLGGSQVWMYGPNRTRHYNSATLSDPSGEVVSRYFKMHPVMFGEYIPLGDRIPLIYQLSPMKNGLTPGSRPVSMEVAGLQVSPSICFESTVPHLIRRQHAELRRSGKSPDVLINVTNDGWFFGAPILDLQLNCSVFRAIENNRPVLVAANTGISAWIDAKGRIVEQAPRRQPHSIVADIRPHEGETMYVRWGDIPAGLCLAVTIVLAVVGMAFRSRPQNSPVNVNAEI